MSTSLETIISAFQTLTDAALATRTGGWQFKVKNYRRVIQILGAAGEVPQSIDHALRLLRAGGMKLTSEREGGPYKSQILLKIGELIETGRLGAVERLEQRPELTATRELLRVPGIGPAKAKTLIAQGIDSLTALEAAVKSSAETGERGPLNDHQLIGFRHYRDLEQRIPREEMEEWVSYLQFVIEQIVEDTGIGVHAAEVVGSYRRGAADSGDIDFHLCLEEGQEGDGGYLIGQLRDYLVGDGALKEQDIWSNGSHKLMGVVRQAEDATARHLDVWVFTQAQYPFALLYATGSANFNIEMRNYALQQGWSLSDKGLCLGDPKGRGPTEAECRERIGSPQIRSERDIFRFLGMQWVEPCDRAAGRVLAVAS